jgi:imidazolonepropionase-like amidohydrolase
MKRKSIRKITKFILFTLASFISIIALSIPVSRLDHIGDKPLPLANNTYAIVHVNVLPFETDEHNTHEMRLDQTVIIKEGKIVSISPTVEGLPINIEVINAQGQYLMPGLVDMHTHLFDRTDLTLYLANGVTTVRNMMGFPMHLKWRKELEENKFAGATLYTASPTINSGDNTGPFHKKVKNTKQVNKAIKKYAEAGYDFIKIYDGLDTALLDAVITEAQKYNMPVAGHPPYAVAIDELMTKDIVSLEHVEEILQGELNYKYNEEKMRLIARKIKQAEMYVTPTLSAYHHILLASELKESFLERDSVEYINPVTRFIGRKQLGDYVEMKDNANVKLKFQIMQMILKVLNEEGVMLLLGTDTGPNLTLPGFTLYNEIVLAMNSGLNSYDILYSGTMNAAKAMGMEAQSGSVSVGKNADLMLLDRNPLEEISTLRHPMAVIKKGVYYDQDALLKMKEQSKNHASTFGTIGRLLDSMISK